jgi:hypothetical protein
MRGQSTLRRDRRPSLDHGTIAQWHALTASAALRTDRQSWGKCGVSSTTLEGTTPGTYGWMARDRYAAARRPWNRSAPCIEPPNRLFVQHCKAALLFVCCCGGVSAGRVTLTRPSVLRHQRFRRHRTRFQIRPLHCIHMVCWRRGSELAQRVQLDRRESHLTPIHTWNACEQMTSAAHVSLPAGRSSDGSAHARGADVVASAGRV